MPDLARLFLSIPAGCKTGFGLEELVEGRSVGKVEARNDFLDRKVRIFQHAFGFEDDIIIDPFRCGPA